MQERTYILILALLCSTLAGGAIYYYLTLKEPAYVFEETAREPSPPATGAKRINDRIPEEEAALPPDEKLPDQLRDETSGGTSSQPKTTVEPPYMQPGKLKDQVPEEWTAASSPRGQEVQRTPGDEARSLPPDQKPEDIREPKKNIEQIPAE